MMRIHLIQPSMSMKADHLKRRRVRGVVKNQEIEDQQRGDQQRGAEEEEVDQETPPWVLEKVY